MLTGGVACVFVELQLGGGIIRDIASNVQAQGAAAAVSPDLDEMGLRFEHDGDVLCFAEQLRLCLEIDVRPGQACAVASPRNRVANAGIVDKPEPMAC